MQANTRGGPRLLGNRVRLHAHDHAPFAHQQQLLACPQHLQAHEHIAVSAEFDRPQPHAGPLLQPELIHRYPFAEAAGAGHQHPRSLAGGHVVALLLQHITAGHPIGQLRRQHIHAHQAVARPEVHGAHPPGGAAQGTQFLIAQPEVDGHPLHRANQHAVSRQGQSNPPEGIALL